MNERLFERSMSSQEHIQSELEDAGISNPGEWREAFNLKDKIPKKKEAREGKIEDLSWQKQLDEAFAQRNFSLIKVLQRVRPEAGPQPELVVARLNELVVSRPDGWGDQYKAVKEISAATEPDPEVVSAEFENLFSRYGQEQNLLTPLKEITNITGFVPSPERVQAKYTSIIKGERSSDFLERELLENIGKLTGIKPGKAIVQELIDQGDILRAKELAPMFGLEIPRGVIQSAYERHFEKTGCLETNLISTLGEKPNPVLMQRVYQRLFQNRREDNDYWLEEIDRLEQLTGVKSIFTPEQLEPFFEESLGNWWGRQKREHERLRRAAEVTGVRISPDLVKRKALEIFGSGQSEHIKEGLQSLKNDLGVDFEITEPEVQDLYHPAIEAREPRRLARLYDVFEVKPNLEPEDARQFILSFIDGSSGETIRNLERIFGIELAATDKEMEAKYDEKIEAMAVGRYGLGNLLHLFAEMEKITGQEWDQEKVMAGLLRLLEKKLLKPEHLRDKNDFAYGGGWGREIGQSLEQSKMVLPPEKISDLYERVARLKPLSVRNLAQLCEISRTTLPANLAQTAYENILSPGYVESVSPEDGKQYNYLDRVSALSEVFKISGVRPQVPESVIQELYRSQLEPAPSSYSLGKIIEVTGITPVFDPEDVGQLYKKLILSDNVSSLDTLAKLTGVELVPDEEIARHLAEKIKEFLQIIKNDSCEVQKYDGVAFSDQDISQAARELSYLVKVKGAELDDAELQKLYAEILAGDRYWATKIRLIEGATGLHPTFPDDQLQARGRQLLIEGRIELLRELAKFGEIRFGPEEIELGYQEILDKNRTYDTGSGRKDYDENWSEKMVQLRELVGVPPSEACLVEFFHNSFEERIDRSWRGDPVIKVIDSIEESFGVKMNEVMSRGIFLHLIDTQGPRWIESFGERVGAIPTIPEDLLRPKVDQILKKKDFGYLEKLKSALGLELLPASGAVVQGVYQNLSTWGEVGEEHTGILEAFNRIFKLTGSLAELLPQYNDSAYRFTPSYKWGDLRKVTSFWPSAEIIQDEYFSLFVVGPRFGIGNLAERVKSFQTLTGQAVLASTVGRAVEQLVSEAKINEARSVVVSTGVKPKVNPAIVQLGYKKSLEIHRSSKSSYSDLQNLASRIDTINEVFNIAPDDDNLAELYIAAFGETDYNNYYEGPDKTMIHIKFWESLVRKFGRPSREVAQRIYLAQLFAQ